MRSVAVLVIIIYKEYKVTFKRLLVTNQNREILFATKEKSKDILPDNTEKTVAQK